MIRGSVWGIPVTVSGYFLLAAVVVFWRDASGMAAWGLLAAVGHELGHIRMMRRVGCEQCEVRIGWCGMRILRRQEVGYGKEWKIHLAGGGVNLLAGMVGAAVYIICGRGEWALRFTAAQWLVGGMNLLPIYPLDGGQALFALLCLRMERKKAERITNGVAFLCLCPLATVGFWVLFRTKYNGSLLLAAIMAMFLLVFKEKH